MKLFKKINILQKMIIAILIVASFNFFNTSRVEASVGGKLAEPFCDLINAIGDGANNIIHTVIYKQKDTVIKVDMVNNVGQVFATILIALLVIVAVAAAVFTGGLILSALIPIISMVGAGTIVTVSLGAGVVAGIYFNSAGLPDNLYLPVYNVSPEEIFSNDINLFDVNFFNPKEDKVATDENGNTIKDKDGNVVVLESTAKLLKSTLANWYVVLRNIAIVALLSILVYIGIRIVISSTAADKSKYKQFLIDWVVALCLLFIMQYIMSFSNLIVEKITVGLGSMKYDKGYVAIIPDKNGKITQTLLDGGMSQAEIDDLYQYTDDGKTEYQKDDDGNKMIAWKTNLMGVARLNSQMYVNDDPSYVGYTVMFIVLVLFTIFFIFTYIKRIIYMAFLTLIAPLVAMTYPIDKMNDGKAQAFDSWLKEYIFNLLIQPLHLILYTILISSAFELAAENMLYSLVALAFMMPAEKLLRKFFGFEKAHTPGLLAGPAGAAVMMSGMNKLLGRAPKGPKSQGERNTSHSADANNNNVKFNKMNNIDSLNKGLNEQNANEEISDSPNISSDRYNDREELLREQTGNENATLPYGREDEAEIYSGYASTSNSNYIDQLDESGIRTNEPQIEEKDQSEPIKTNNDGHLKRAIGTVKRVGGAGASFYAHGMADKIRSKAKNAHPLRKLPKLAGGIAGGIAAGSFGLAAGIASGDMSKVAQFTAAGALGGYKAGSGVTEAGRSAFTVDGFDEEIARSYHGDNKYEDKQRKEYAEEVYRNNRAKIKKYNKGKSENDQLSRRDVQSYTDYGVSDIKDIMAAKTLVNDGTVKNIDESVALARLAKESFGDKGITDYDKAGKYLNKKFQSSKAKPSKEMAEKMTKDTITKLDRFYENKA